VKPVKITETALRDGHQSLIATRMTTEEMLPILDKMDQVGYYSMEVWGGATFDACLRFLNEDPWERLREIRKVVKNTKLQMLLRGQNLLGYKHYPDDVVEAFIKKSVENGIDIIRVFDALNDVRNLETSMRVIKEAGAHCQCAISYTTSKVHTVEYFVKLSKKMEQMGADSICIKDMAGILTPYSAYALVKKLKDAVKIPIQLHTHCTSGIAAMTYLKAVEAGVDIIDTAISPFSEGTSQPATESMVVTLGECERVPNMDIKLLNDIADYFKPIRDKYRENGILNPKVMDVEPNTLTYQVPGGMLSNLMSQLKGQGALHRYEEVLKEIPKVREDLGFPPLVTPLSQMVGTQAVFNVLSGERYKMVPKEIKEYVKGLYGSSPAPIKEEIRKKIIGDEEVITIRPADLLQPEIEKYKAEIGDVAKSLEDVLSYILFPQVAKKFFEDKLKAKTAAQKDESNISNIGKESDGDKKNKEEVHYITVTM
jgi:oxaloacetate decarboxylase alpha subunit